MCGRYALNIRAAFVRHQFQQRNIPVDDAPEDDETRETYNFAPGYYGLVYRADSGHMDHPLQGHASAEDAASNDEHIDAATAKNADRINTHVSHIDSSGKPPKYKLQAMKWGLIPSWTKRNASSYGTLMKTINCRDDSLLEDRGMWTPMKRKKRCIVVAQGFYEWLKKNDGKEKIPHFVRRKDGQLMLFAGLWDSVQYEGSDQREYTYTIITTNVSKELSFLHDRMPAILENGSDAMWTWLDPSRTQWTNELQSLLRPFDGELDYYVVSKEVGKVGNNSPDFIVPVASSENKQNIANFFNAQKEQARTAGTMQKTDGKKLTSPPLLAKKRSAEDSKDTTPTKAVKIERDVNKVFELSPSSTSPSKKTSKTVSAVSNGPKPKAVDASTQKGNQRITNFFGKS